MMDGKPIRIDGQLWTDEDTELLRRHVEAVLLGMGGVSYPMKANILVNATAHLLVGYGGDEDETEEMTERFIVHLEGAVAENQKGKDRKYDA